MASCPECEADVPVDNDLETGEIILCEECGAELEVISEDPLAFALAPDEEEDWENRTRACLLEYCVLASGLRKSSCLRRSKPKEWPTKNSMIGR